VVPHRRQANQGAGAGGRAQPAWGSWGGRVARCLGDVVGGVRVEARGGEHFHKRRTLALNCALARVPSAAAAQLAGWRDTARRAPRGLAGGGALMVLEERREDAAE